MGLKFQRITGQALAIRFHRTPTSRHSDGEQYSLIAVVLSRRTIAIQGIII
ncbi:MAG: hypothetical protein PHW65_02045 [Dehalococcoidales bacterium]|nr:hypothetical protein [Dehalococcoidales bacterium]